MFWIHRRTRFLKPIPQEETVKKLSGNCDKNWCPEWNRKNNFMTEYGNFWNSILFWVITWTARASSLYKKKHLGYTTQYIQNKWTKILSLEMTIFGLKMMEKSGLEKIFWNYTCPFRVAAAQCRKSCPERLNWSGWLAGISEGVHGVLKSFY